MMKLILGIAAIASTYNSKTKGYAAPATLCGSGDVSIFTNLNDWEVAVDNIYNEEDFNNIPNALNPSNDPGGKRLIDRSLENSWNFNDFTLSTYAEGTNPGEITGNAYDPTGYYYDFIHDVDGTDFLQFTLKDDRDLYREITFHFPSAVYGFSFEYVVSWNYPGVDKIILSVEDTGYVSMEQELTTGGIPSIIGFVFPEGHAGSSITLTVHQYYLFINMDNVRYTSDPLPTCEPTQSPTQAPTAVPTQGPTQAPTASPTSSATSCLDFPCTTGSFSMRGAADANDGVQVCHVDPNTDIRETYCIRYYYLFFFSDDVSCGPC